MNEQASAWWNAVDGLRLVYERMRRVVVLHDDAMKVIVREDGENTLHFCDPPYLHETRVSADVYDCEMSVEAHTRLLVVLGEVKGKFMLCGYHSELYDRHAKRHGWKCHEFEIDNKAAGGKKKRKMTECCWTNF